jgi:predicted ribosomally synthesized peptide with nif11-like leader
MSREDLEAFRAYVHRDVSLAQRLRRVPPGRFTEEILRLAGEAGHDVTATDLDEALARARQAWILRWIR